MDEEEWTWKGAQARTSESCVLEVEHLHPHWFSLWTMLGDSNDEGEMFGCAEDVRTEIRKCVGQPLDSWCGIENVIVEVVWRIFV